VVCRKKGVSEYLFTPRANNDLEKIWQFIAKDSASTADRVEAAIFDTCKFAADRPDSGTVRTDFTSKKLRFMLVQGYRNYGIAYYPASKPLQIVAVIQMSQNIPRLLRGR
jgi:plasmid stabilization system protein ParE